jgi:thiamine kinase-like enzyme
LDSFSEGEKIKVRNILSLDMKAFLDSFREQVPRLKSRIVFGHFDFHNRNVLLRDDDTLPFEDRLVIIDVEMSSYFHRGYDFATHFHTMRLDHKQDGDFREVKLIGPPSLDRKRFFLREYLKAWRELNPLTFDPVIDNVDHLVLESDIFEALRGLIWLIFNRQILESESNHTKRETMLDLNLVNTQLCRDSLLMFSKL